MLEARGRRAPLEVGELVQNLVESGLQRRRVRGGRVQLVGIVLLGPPLDVFWLLTRLHIVMELIEVVPDDSPLPPSQIPTRP